MKKRKILTIVLMTCCFGMDGDCEPRVCCLPNGTCEQDFNACFTGGFLADSCEECQMGLRCCLRDGNCVEVLSITDCTNRAGTIINDCDACESSAQNCCFPNGDCRPVAVDADCRNMGGTPFVNLLCDECPDPNEPETRRAICCFPDGLCRSAILNDPVVDERCGFEGANIIRDGTCAEDCPAPNETGACCAGGDCADGFLRIECGSGSFFVGQNCSNVICPDDDD
ncbi:MAG: hypothetical protein MI923_28840 [Phycisphaerales bacterium]|nr:hypothetical protein [Phycisphaerales bacterium]